MSNPWIRLYRDSLHDPKIVTLSDRHHRAWHNCLLIADDTGTLPALRDIAVHMRMSITDAEQMLIDLVEAELIDVNMLSGSRSYRMHGWAKRQYVSDVSTLRSKKHRAKKTATDMQRCSDANATPPESESDTETDINLVPSVLDTAPANPRKPSKAKELDFKFDLGRTGRTKDANTLTRRAEGLGLPVAEIQADTERAKPDNPTAYFTRICINRLRDQLPGIDEPVLRDALWGKSPASYTAVMDALLLVEAAPCPRRS